MTRASQDVELVIRQPRNKITLDVELPQAHTKSARQGKFPGGRGSDDCWAAASDGGNAAHIGSFPKKRKLNAAQYVAGRVITTGDYVCGLTRGFRRRAAVVRKDGAARPDGGGEKCH